MIREPPSDEVRYTMRDYTLVKIAGWTKEEIYRHDEAWLDGILEAYYAEKWAEARLHNPKKRGKTKPVTGKRASDAQLRRMARDEGLPADLPVEQLRRYYSDE